MNFGGEDIVLDLGRHRYDDLKWHTVKVSRSAEVISMVIDDSTTARDRVPDDYSVLNIDHGIYVGGVDTNTSKKFDHQLRFFRGALDYMKVNSLDILDEARKLSNPYNVREVSWDIDPIFSAPRESPVSYLSETSFASFSHIHPSNVRSVSFLLKTHTPDAVLLYSYTHMSQEKHYIALELIDMKLKLTIGLGEKALTLNTQRALEDKWHQIDITVGATHLEISIDGERYIKQLEEELNIGYGGVMFVGGLNQDARLSARHDNLESLQGENSMKGGIIGCINKLNINSRVYYLHDIQASRLIGAQCETERQCQGNGCTPASAGQHSPDVDHSSDSNTHQPQLLAISAVIVKEGGQVTVTTDNIEIVYDYKKYGIRESEILLYVVKKPRHGEIEVDLGRRRSSDVFTYLDVLGEKVVYKHHGDEEEYDEVQMEVEIATFSNTRGEKNLPAKTLQRFDFVLPVTVLPVNDAPRIILQNRGILTIIKNSKVGISPEFLHVEDPETPASQLKFMVIEPSSQGYFEKSGHSGTPITEFTQAEVNNREIWFLHIGSGNAEVSLKVFDGESYSNPVKIFIQTVQLNLTVLKNTGLVLPHGSYALITRENLTTISNVPEQEVEIVYEVRRKPEHGVLERQQYANGEWQDVTSFAQRHINNGHVRLDIVQYTCMIIFIYDYCILLPHLINR